VGVARRAGQSVSTGSGNTHVGFEVAGYLSSGTGSNNTAIGAYAHREGSGDNNICIGYNAGRSGQPGGLADGNEVYLGNTAIATFNCQVGVSAASDKRDKTDVEPLTMGLSFINQLKPVTYRWDKRSSYVLPYRLALEPDDPDYINLADVVPDGSKTEPQLCAGMLAQDVEEIEQTYGFDKEDLTNLITNVSKDGQAYSLQYERFVPMLIKSVQELSEQVESLKDEIETLKE
jgi:hypothetical protein